MTVISVGAKRLTRFDFPILFLNSCSITLWRYTHTTVNTERWDLHTEYLLANKKWRLEKEAIRRGREGEGREVLTF